MLTVEEAQARIQAALVPLGVEERGLAEAVGCVVASPIAARRTLPRFDNSAMDGYAVRAEDTQGASESQPVRLRLLGHIAAGDASRDTVTAGAALGITTGAQLPLGANAVVKQEDTTLDGNDVLIRAPASPNQFVRPQGGDLTRDAALYAPGTRLSPADIGILAAQGTLRLITHKRPRVAIVPTGSEIIDIDREPRGSQVNNANAWMLRAQVESSGATATLCPIAPDDPQKLAQALTEAAQSHDLVLTIGGVSVGRHDYVKDVLRAHGQVDFWRIAIKPGKPLAFGHLGNTPVIGLPGNPISSFVGFELFVRGALTQLSGSISRHNRVRVQLGAAITPNRERREFLRATLVQNADGTWLAQPLARQDSHQWSSLLGADALLDIPASDRTLAVGDPALAILLPGHI